MPSQVDVINGAVRLVAGTRITSLTDGSKNANVAQDLFNELVEDLLRSHPWNFATERKKLAQSSTAPTYEFDHAYPLPSDWMRTIAVHGNDAGTGTIIYKSELIAGQRAIVTSADDVWMTYVSKVTDPNIMTVDFRRALQLSMARDMAVTIAASNKLQEQLESQAKRMLARARSSDSMGQFPERRPRGSWVEARGRVLPIVSDG